jgi:hypothetical protein
LWSRQIIVRKSKPSFGIPEGILPALCGDEELIGLIVAGDKETHKPVAKRKAAPSADSFQFGWAYCLFYISVKYGIWY